MFVILNPAQLGEESQGEILSSYQTGGPANLLGGHFVQDDKGFRQANTDVRSLAVHKGK